MEISLCQIGVIHTPFHDKVAVPIQSSHSEVSGVAEVFPQYLEGLDGIEEFSYIYLLYHFHQARKEVSLHVRPFLDDQLHGVFATRFPVRPNPIGFSVVRLIKRMETQLHFSGADMLDGTPLLDIKPYIPEFDIFTVSETGWFGARKHKDINNPPVSGKENKNGSVK